jgi:hypothetical protein
MSSEGVEQLIIEHSAARCEAAALRGDQGLKGCFCAGRRVFLINS